jgi:hypothetical protein
MNHRPAYLFAAGVTLALLVACPLRNLAYLDSCFGAGHAVMDVPAWELRLEARLVALQVCLAVLGAIALASAAWRSRAARLGACVTWTLVAAGGVAWDKLLGNFQGEVLPPNSIYACLLDGRSAHTHSMLSNLPLMLSVPLALSIFWPGKGVTNTNRRNADGEPI